MRIVPSSIRSKLILLGFLTLLPVVFLMLFNAWNQAKAEIEKETARMRNILDFVVLHEEGTVRGTKILMAALADVAAVRGGGAGCNEFLAGVLRNSPGYVNFGVARTDGRVVCSAIPLTAPVDMKGLPHFEGALKGRSFAMGRHIVGRIVGRHIVPVAYPVIDGGDRVSAVLFASLDLFAVTKLEIEIAEKTPMDSVYMKLDDEGVVVTAYPESSLFPVGSRLERSLFGKFSREREATFRDTGADGIERLYLASRYQEQFSGPGGYVLLGVPVRPIFEESRRRLAGNLAVLSLIGAAGFGILWLAGNAMIARPVRVLTEASRRLGAGDLSVRTGLGSVPGEFGQLGRAFDETAAALERGRDESRRMQEELRAAATAAENERAKSEAVIAGIGDGINIVDRDFRILYQNEALKAAVGDHAGDLCYKAFHGREGICRGCVVDLSFRDGKVHTGEILGSRDGRPVFLEVTASPLRDASGGIVAGIEVVRDVTERRETARLARKSVGMLSALHAVDLNILRGAGLEDTLGVVCDAIIRMGYQNCWVALAAPDRSARIVAARGDRTGFFDGLEIRWDDSPLGRGSFGTVVRTGRTFHARDVLADPRFEPWKDRFAASGLRSMATIPLKSGDGAVAGALMVCSEREGGFSREEIEELETFAQQCAVATLGAKWIGDLRDANQRLTFYVNRMPMGYVVWDLDFRVLEWNPAAERIFGWRAEEAIGRRAMEFLVPEEEKAAVGEHWEKLAGGEESYSVNGNLRKDGKRIQCEWFNGPLHDNEGRLTGVLSVVHDVTEKVLLEKQLQTAQRMEAVGTLAGGVAHDFNNALTGIFGFGEMLRPYLKGDAVATSYLNEVMRSAERAATLTRQLLAYSRRQAVTLSSVNLNDVVRDLFKLLSKVAGEKVELNLSLAGELPAIHADPGQLEQVIMNLVINARDAMPDGGRLAIETSVATLDEDNVRYRPHMSAGTFVVLTVSDTGVGMDAATRERIFEPFFTTKGPSKGTGLGLAMVYGIVKQHNGFIHLESEVGRGTTFRIHFPPAPGGAPAAAPPAGQPELRGGTETVLLAEDDEQVRTLVEEALRDLGYTVLSAGDGREAVDIFRRRRGEISLAVLDMAMPVMGGKEAYEAIHAIAPGLKVLFMSGYAAEGAGETFLLVAGVPFLSKPFGPAELARKVRAVLDGS
jgi:PAS domain S-box-containing protein